MGKPLPPEELELYRRCDEVLHYVWDPIGVSDSPWARDEYTGYLPGVFELVVSGASEGELVGHLLAIARDRMGLPGDEEGATLAAGLLLDWKEKILGGAD